MKNNKVFARKPNDVGTYYNRTGKKDKDGKAIFETLNVSNFTGIPMYNKNR